uniref:Uncharacterized protein n=1 Tax=uncultured microorganism TaxID=358574 RepID=L8B140_9ZZZZ|nr:hypothetical protein [uncultured microorganism]
MRRNSVGRDLLGLRVDDHFDVRYEQADDLDQRLGIDGFDLIDGQFRLGRRGGLRRLWLLRHRHRLNDLRDRLDEAGAIRHQHLVGLRQGNTLAVRSQEGRDFLDDVLRLASLQRKQHADEFEFAALVQLVQRNARDHAFRIALPQVDEPEHALAADQSKTFRQQDAVEQVDGFRRCVLAGVGVVERAGWRRIEHQRQVRLLSEPLQNIDPLLVTKVEPELALGRLFGGSGRFRLGF